MNRIAYRIERIRMELLLCEQLLSRYGSWEVTEMRSMVAEMGSLAETLSDRLGAEEPPDELT
ncbi:MAG: hypothetical protein ABW003_16625 [Microvirga sp.]